MEKLVKEIVTTTTEKFHEDGALMERITEQREKIYDKRYTEQTEESVTMEENATEEKETTPEEKVETTIQEELVKEAAANIDAQNPQNRGMTPPPGYKPINSNAGLPQYNVVGRQGPTSQSPTFPWEQPRY